jgi:hypothetical protein
MCRFRNSWSRLTCVLLVVALVVPLGFAPRAAAQTTEADV